MIGARYSAPSAATRVYTKSNLKYNKDKRQYVSPAVGGGNIHQPYPYLFCMLSNWNLYYRRVSDD
jgi:hypothetical protein